MSWLARDCEKERKWKVKTCKRFAGLIQRSGQVRLRVYGI